MVMIMIMIMKRIKVERTAVAMQISVMDAAVEYQKIEKSR